MNNIYQLCFVVFLILQSCGPSQVNNIPSEIEEAEVRFGIKEVMKDGMGDFDPWNQQRWAKWYNEKDELIRPFGIDTSVKFQEKETTWILRLSDSLQEVSSKKCVISIDQQGIILDGNGVILERRPDLQRMDLQSLYARRKEAWAEGFDFIGIFNNLQQMDGFPPTRIQNFIFKGLKRGIKVDGTVKEDEHRLIVEDCTFERNKIGFYTNGFNTLVYNCKFIENGYGGIYSGSGSAHNQFKDNEFRDNCLSQHQYSYGDFIGDTFWDTEISGNRFMRSKIDAEFRHIGISIFRNMGESGKLRKQISRFNQINNNYFDGYSVAIHVGARMGRNTRNDVTGEGRDYAFYNIIESNFINNTTIGIKINTEGNTIKNNSFTDVENDIVLHCVFFELKNTSITDQKNDQGSLWYVLEDYKEYAHWFNYQDDLNGRINKNEKLISVYSSSGHPDFPINPGDIFVLNPQEAPINHKIYDHRFGAPLAVISGEISLELEGEEKIAIWDEPFSRVGDTDYYSILIFDENGTEINRCGRSENPWKQIAAGHFINKEDPMEIAALSSKPVDGKYPVFIFDRGYRIAKDTLYQDNEDERISISTNDRHELVVDFL